MGAKFWSKAETTFFMEEVLPYSIYAERYHDATNGGMTFHELAIIMQYEMDKIKHMREYTHTVLFQHYYQRIVRKEPKDGPPKPLSATKLEKIRVLRTRLASGYYDRADNGQVHHGNNDEDNEMQDRPDEEFDEEDDDDEKNTGGTNTPSMHGRRKNKSPYINTSSTHRDTRLMPPNAPDFMSTYAAPVRYAHSPPEDDSYFAFVLNERIQNGEFYSEDDEEDAEEDELPASSSRTAHPKPYFPVPTTTSRSKNPNSQVPIFKQPVLKNPRATKPKTKPTPRKKLPAKKTSAKKTPAKKTLQSGGTYISVRDSSPADVDSSESEINPQWMSGGSSPVGIPRFDIQKAATAPLKVPTPYKVGRGAESKPWAIFEGALDGDDSSEIEMEDGDVDLRPFFEEGLGLDGRENDDGGDEQQDRGADA